MAAYINTEGGGGGDEVGPIMCPNVEDPDLVFQKASYLHSPTHPRPAEFDIEIDNDERGVIGDFTTISDIRITKAKPE